MKCASCASRIREKGFWYDCHVCGKRFCDYCVQQCEDGCGEQFCDDCADFLVTEPGVRLCRACCPECEGRRVIEGIGGREVPCFCCAGREIGSEEARV